ncbi:MAG: NYN domain-containing protein [Deltaproteobacteria bacterium]|nr:NYN domain-containing protein [Deltaproteobacteria bacterium]
MRVVIFFDGANFFSSWADCTARRKVDFGKLAGWLVERVGGDDLWGAYYYTGVEPDDDPSHEGLDRFLDQLESVPGFFVRRLPRKPRSRTCSACGAEVHFTQEKEVDTSIVADMLGLAHQDGFDICVLASGDADMCPAVEGVRAMGKKVFVATWGLANLSQHLRRAAFDHIELTEGLETFALEPLAPAPSRSDESDFIAELRRAQIHFEGGYVGHSYFLTRWESPSLDPDEQKRRDVLDRLIAADSVEAYQAPDGTLAIRIKPPTG